MSWIVESSLNFFQRLCVNVLKCGPIPSHVALIMDGNRRYAKKTNVQKAVGHTKGFDKLSETLQWCRELGINEVTVYAFSIENFKRSKEEVDTLMELAREKFEHLLDEKDELMEQGVCIRVIGNMNLLSPEVRKLIAEAVLLTKDNRKAFLNVAFAYTSRDEITNAVQTVVQGVQDGLLTVDDIDEALIDECMYTKYSPDPDILVRTSGEVRFSDFLLWQNRNALVCFTDVLWPEFCIWHLLAAVFKYQRSYGDLKRFSDENRGVCDRSEKVREFVSKLDESRWKQLKCYADM